MTPAQRVAAIQARRKQALASAPHGMGEALRLWGCPPEHIDFYSNAPADIAWLLERVEALEQALRDVLIDAKCLHTHVEDAEQVQQDAETIMAKAEQSLAAASGRDGKERTP